MRRNALLAFIPAIATLALLPGDARAQLAFNLSTASRTASPGKTLTFSGTLSNIGSSEVFLNGIAFNFSGSAGTFLTGDDTPFFTDVPFSLTAGSAYTGAIFGINVAANTPLSSSFQGSVNILGGSGTTPDALDTLASQNFQVIVPSRTTAAPEPGSLLLLLPVLGVVKLLGKRRR